MEVRKGDYMSSRLFSDVKKFVKYIQQRSYLLQALMLSLFIGFVFYQINTNNLILNQIKKTEKKVDFRYFNTTRTLEDIHNVEIETKQGRVVRLITKQ